MVLLQCYQSVDLGVRNQDCVEEKADMIDNPLASEEIEKHIKRVGYLIGYVREAKGRGAESQKKEWEEVRNGQAASEV